MYRNLQNMDLNLLIALDVLLQEQHVSRASDHLSLSQSATSRVLSRLRDMFGDPLLVKTGDGMVMTQRAKQLKPMIKHSLDVMEKLFIGDTFDPLTTTRNFSLRATSYVSQAYLPEVVSRIAREAPNCSIQIENLSGENFNSQQNEDVDLIICGDGFDIPQNFKQKHIGVDKMICIMSKNHPLAHKKISLNDYVSYGHCQMTLGVGSVTASIDRLLGRIKHKRHVRLKLPHVMACMEMVAKSDFLHTNASNLARKFLPVFNLTMKELPFEYPLMDYSIYWHPIHHQNPAHVWLRNICSDEIKKIFAPNL